MQGQAVGDALPRHGTVELQTQGALGRRGAVGIEIGPPQGASLQIDKLGVSPAGETAVGFAGKQLISLGQTVEVELHHMNPGLNPFDVVETILVGHYVGAIFQVNPHPGEAWLFGVLQFTTADQHPSENDGLGAEKILPHLHGRRRRIGKAAELIPSAGGIGCPTDPGAGGHLHHIGQFPADSGSQVTQGDGQAAPPFAQLGLVAAKAIDAQRPALKAKTRGQQIADHDLPGSNRGVVVLHPQPIGQKVADADHWLTGGFLHPQAIGLGGGGDIDTHRRPGLDPKGFAAGTGHNGVGSAGQVLQLRGRHLGWQQITGRRNDHQPVAARRDQRKAVAARRELIEAAGAVGGAAAGGQGRRIAAHPVVAEHRGRLTAEGIDQRNADVVKGRAATVVEHDPQRINQGGVDAGVGAIEGIGVIGAQPRRRGNAEYAITGRLRPAGGGQIAEKHAAVGPHFRQPQPLAIAGLRTAHPHQHCFGQLRIEVLIEVGQTDKDRLADMKDFGRSQSKGVGKPARKQGQRRVGTRGTGAGAVDGGRDQERGRLPGGRSMLEKFDQRRCPGEQGGLVGILSEGDRPDLIGHRGDVVNPGPAGGAPLGKPRQPKDQQAQAQPCRPGRGEPCEHASPHRRNPGRQTGAGQQDLGVSMSGLEGHQFDLSRKRGLSLSPGRRLESTGAPLGTTVFIRW